MCSSDLILSILSFPIKNVVFSQADARVMPATDKVAVASKFISDNFPGQAANPIEIIIKDGVGKESEITNYASEVGKIPGVISVGMPEVHGSDIRISVIHSMGVRTPEVTKVIHAIRDLKAPSGTMIGGVAADYTDSQDGIARVLPYALIWIVFFVLLFLFIFTGSIILPIKAIFLNILSDRKSTRLNSSH